MHSRCILVEAPTPKNNQAHSNKSSAVADELSECVWLFSGVGA